MRKAIPTLVVARAIMHDVTPWDGIPIPEANAIPPTSKPPVYAVPVPVVATPAPSPATKPVTEDRPIPDPVATPAPVTVAGVPIRTYTRGAEYKCPKCKRMVPVGGSVACDSKQRLVCLTCAGVPTAAPVDRAVPAAPESRKPLATEIPADKLPAIAPGGVLWPAPVTKCPHCDVSKSGEHASKCPSKPAPAPIAPAPKPEAPVAIKPARYASLCPLCKLRIEAGDLIRVQKGYASRHATCPTVTPTDDNPETKPEAPAAIEPPPVDHDAHVTAYLERETAPKPVETAPVVACGKCGTTKGAMVRSPRGRMFCGKCATDLAFVGAIVALAKAAASLPDAPPVETVETTTDDGPQYDAHVKAYHADMVCPAVVVDLPGLRRALSLAAFVADRKSTMPILANAKFYTVGQRTYLAATDLNTAITVDVDAHVETAGAFTVGAQSLAKSLPPKGNGTATLRLTGHPITAPWLTVETGSAKLKLQGLAARDFPKLPTACATKDMRRAALVEMLESTLHAIATDETRYHLSGVMLTREGDSLLAVTTDGHRLSLCRRHLEGYTGPDFLDAEGHTRQIIVPRRGVQVLLKVLKASCSNETVGLGVDKSNLTLHCGDCTVTVKLIDAQFPPYEMVIPRDHDRVVTVDTKPMVDALKQAASVAADRVKACKLSIGVDTLRITSDNPDLGESTVEIPMTLDRGSPGLDIGVNAAYMLDWIKGNADDSGSLVLEFSGALDPIIARLPGSSDTLGVTMPMRI